MGGESGWGCRVLGVQGRLQKSMGFKVNGSGQVAKRKWVRANGSELVGQGKTDRASG